MINFDLLKSQIGENLAVEYYNCRYKLIAVEVKDGRVQILSIAEDDGWCSGINLHTTCSVEDGLYIMTVLDVNYKNESVVFTIDPLKRIDKTIIDSKEMCALFYMSGLFAESGIPNEEFNYDLLIRNACLIDRSINRYYAAAETELKKVVHLYLCDKMSSEEIIKSLSVLTQKQETERWLNAECIKLLKGVYADRYPLLTAYIKQIHASKDTVVYFVKELLNRAMDAVLRNRIKADDYGDIFGQIERYLNLNLMEN